jgi:acyl carrier protein
MDTMERLQSLMRSLFDDESLTISRATTAQDIEAWDSVQNVTLMLEVERVFLVRFSTSEMAYLKNVGELADLIETKQRKAQ